MPINEISAAKSALTLADFTSPGLIVPSLEGDGALEVIHELCQAMQREKRLQDLLPFYHAAMNREFLVSCDVGAVMAFPHARLPGLKELSFALGRSDEPLRWGAKPDRSVRLVFLLAIPSTDAAQYLTLMSGLARVAKDSRLVEELLAVRANFQILEIFQRVELRTNHLLNKRKRISAVAVPVNSA
jgi:mannitol/fructose-specific phosphotransferase system IIA component (Ntr-type)